MQIRMWKQGVYPIGRHCTTVLKTWKSYADTCTSQHSISKNGTEWVEEEVKRDWGRMTLYLLTD
jgi:hypothetical protein